MKNEQDDDLEAFGLVGVVREEGKVETTGAADQATGKDILDALVANTPSFHEVLSTRLGQRPEGKLSQDWTLRTPEFTLPPHSVRTQCVNPGAPFQCKAIRSNGDHKNLYIRQIFVGQKPQLKQGWPVSIFSGRRHAAGPVLDICPPGVSISITVENIGDTPATLSLSLVGDYRTS